MTCTKYLYRLKKSVGRIKSSHFAVPFSRHSKHEKKEKKKKIIIRGGRGGLRSGRHCAPASAKGHLLAKAPIYGKATIEGEGKRGVSNQHRTWETAKTTSRPLAISFLRMRSWGSPTL